MQEGRIMQAVKGLSGKYHATTGEWTTESKLKTLCGVAISPNYRRMDTRAVKCDKCLERLNKSVIVTSLVA